jgi:hypothetical protein
MMNYQFMRSEHWFSRKHFNPCCISIRQSSLFPPFRACKQILFEIPSRAFSNAIALTETMILPGSYCSWRPGPKKAFAARVLL